LRFRLVLASVSYAYREVFARRPNLSPLASMETETPIMTPDHRTTPRARPDVLVSVILPVFNEARVLCRLVHMVGTALERCACEHEILFVNDGSRDGSKEILDHLADTNAHVKVLRFSRNFGHQAAVQAGLEHAQGDAAIVMDSDLQDDPACLPRLVDKWREGYDVVYAVRADRKECAAKRFLFYAFYRILDLVAQSRIPKDAGNFGLIDREVVEALLHVPDRDRFFAGLRSWVGYRQTGIVVERAARYDGRPRVSLRGLWRLAKTAVFSFSTAPVGIFYWLAGLSLAGFAAVASFSLCCKLFGSGVPDWSIYLSTACFFGALNALGIAILGEYITRIYDQVRGRPLYLVAEKRNFGSRQRKFAPGRQAERKTLPTTGRQGTRRIDLPA
jgi:dolichol-phosphate mannosyltransferase